MAATTEGLRERKKRQTREAIAQAAMVLFVEHGFDAVTVADVARAADVSEKTVFNYFPAKEDLVLVVGEERRAALIEAIRTRPAGTSIVEPFRAATLEFVERVERDSVESIVAVPRLVAGSRALRNRLFLGWEEEAATAGPGHRRGDRLIRGRPRARGDRAHAGVGAPARLPRRLPAAAGRRGPARGGRRPARPGRTAPTRPSSRASQATA